MIVARTLEELRAACSDLPRPLGLVPTMGYLHDGHLSLVAAASRDCPAVGVSIFVNPSQFGPGEDYESYPRDEERDLKLLRSAAVDVVWLPQVVDLYPETFQTWVEVEEVTRRLEGAHRPGHFRGVTTIVAKLFHAFGPQRAYFGQKDAQQLVVIRRMVADLSFPLEVVSCPTVREPDGLALSSRNSYLDERERAAATVLIRALRSAVRAHKGGVRQADKLRERMEEVLAEQPLAKVEYVSIADPVTLEELEGEVDTALLSMAVYFGSTRLIDNMIIGDVSLGG